MRTVTTYPPKHWEMYVRHNLSTMDRLIDGELLVYQEADWQGASSAGLEFRPLADVDGLVRFLDRCEGFPPARGIFGLKYDYRFDAWKFCRKVFAMQHASQGRKGLMLWMDADCEVLKPFGEAECREWMDGKPIALFQRPGYHSETGFVLFDLDQRSVHGILMGMVAAYVNDVVFTLSGWTDSYVIDEVLRVMEVPVTNLTPSSATGLDVMAQSPLAAFYRHDKGARKGDIAMAEAL